MFIAFRYLGDLFRVDFKRIPLCITIFSVGVRTERVPAAQSVNPQDLLPYLLCDSALQLFSIDREVSQKSLFDVGIMLIAGVVGYFMQKGGYPASPVVLALIMGPMAESNFRRALSLSGGSLDFLYTRPITLALLTLAAFTLLTPIIRKIMRLRRQ